MLQSTSAWENYTTTGTDKPELWKELFVRRNMFWVEIVFVKSGNIRNGTRRRHVANRNLSQLNSFARQRVCPHKYFMFVFSLVLLTDVCQNYINNFFVLSFLSKACSNKVWRSENFFIQVQASVLILAFNSKGLDLSKMKQHQSGRFDWDENTLFGKMLSIWGQRKRVSQESFQIFHSGASTETFTIYFHFFPFHFRFPYVIVLGTCLNFAA